MAYDTVIPFRFCAPPPPGLLQYCDITYPVSLCIVLTVTLSLTVKSTSVSHHEVKEKTGRHGERGREKTRKEKEERRQGERRGGERKGRKTIERES